MLIHGKLAKRFTYPERIQKSKSYIISCWLLKIEEWENKNTPTEDRIQEQHAIIQVISSGRRPKRVNTGRFKTKLEGVTDGFQDTSKIVKIKSEQYTTLEPELLRHLDAEQRVVFGLLALKQDFVATTNSHNYLQILDITLRVRLKSGLKMASWFRAMKKRNESVRSCLLQIIRK